MQYKGAGKNARDRTELGADYILQGSVARGDRVRIVAATDIENATNDLLVADTTIAAFATFYWSRVMYRAQSRAIKLKLSPEESARLTIPQAVDPDAYELYLKGRYFWNKRGEANFVKAIDYFQQAITAIRSTPRRTLVLLTAMLYSVLRQIPTSRGAGPCLKRGPPRRKHYSSMKLWPTLTPPSPSLKCTTIGIWPGSEREFQRALNLNPNYATAHEWYAYSFTAQGSTDKAIEQLQYAQKADPLSLIINADTSEMLSYAGR